MKLGFISGFLPHWIRSSITLKVVIYVGAAIVCLVALQTFINIDKMRKELTPLISQELRNTLNQSENILKIVNKQTREDAQLIGSQNALTNFIDYEMLDDVEGMNEEIVNLEQFLRSLTSFKKQYQHIEIITGRGSIIHFHNGEIEQESTIEHQENAYFSLEDEQILFTLNYFFKGDNAFVDGSGSQVIISISNNITAEVMSLVNVLKTEHVDLTIQSNNQYILGKQRNINAQKTWVEESLLNNKLNVKLTVFKDKKQAYLLITNMEDAAFMLAVASIIVISISLFLTSKYIISAPLKSIIQFINHDILQQHNLVNRYETNSVDEIGVFSRGLNDMLDQLQCRQNELKNSEERLALALWGGGEGMWEYKISNNLIFLDRGSCEILGLEDKPTSLSLSDFMLMIHKDDRTKMTQYIETYRKGEKEIFEIEFRLFSNKKFFTWVQLKGKLSKKRKNNFFIGITGILRDITEELRAEQEIRLYATAFNSSSSAIAILNTNFKIIAVNKAFNQITGFSSEESTGDFSNFIQNSNEVFRVDDIHSKITKHGYWHAEVVGKRKNDDVYVKDMIVNPVYGKNYLITHYVCVFADITEKKKSEVELWNMANYDMLTKLPNRGYFRKTLNTAINKSQISKDLIALLFIDLDKFKQVNDTLGHEAGDDLLKKTAGKLIRNIRKNDTVARLGGDEFAIILEGINETKNAEYIAKKITDEFKKGISVQGKPTNVGASIGVSFYPHDAENAETLIHCADTAMYSAKTSGSNLYQLYHSAMGDHVNRRNLIEQELNIALKEDGLCLYYQPQLDLATGKIVSFEALSRWFHPELGFIPPDEFIPIAEETGLIAELGLNVFEQASKQLHTWHQQGYADMRMAINVSAKQFLLTDIHIDVANSIKRNGLDPKYLELELTESLIVEDPEKIIKMLHAIKNVGVRLSIDDFGTGYSSLSYLSQFPLDILKIDKSFVQQTENDKRSLALTKAIVGIAQSLQLEVIAEGVETKEQLNILKSLGCHYMQGYYFSPAVSAEEATRLLNENSGLDIL